MLSPTDVPNPENFRVYVVMWNLPGCVPEMEPRVYHNVVDAYDDLLSEVSYMMDICEDEDTATMWHNMWHNIAHTPVHDLPNNWAAPDGYVYSISMDYER